MVKKVVYVLGAGASKDAGGPLVKDFFSRSDLTMEKIHKNYFDNNLRFQLLESAYTQWSQTELNPTVESFFNRLDFQRLIHKVFYLESYNDTINTDTLYRYLTWYIAALVRNSIAYKKNMPNHYSEFVQKIKKRGEKPSIISFNYDLVFEKQIIKSGGSVNYHLYNTVKKKPLYLDKDGITFLKLHGSLNWIRCPKCQSIYIQDEPRAHKYNQLRCTIRCGGKKKGLIIPPNLNKSSFLEPLGNIWKKADERLIKADKIVIIGYSLPEVDYAARELLSWSSRTVKELTIVSDSPNPINSIMSRLGINKCIQFTNGFKEYVENHM